MAITGAARLAGIMGWPVAHSRSPALHGFWLGEHGIDGAYVPLAVQPDRLEQALRALPALGFRGCNLTIPHKQAALAVDGPGRSVRPPHRRDEHGHRRCRRQRSKAATPMSSASARTCASRRRTGTRRRGRRWCSAPAARPGRWSQRCPTAGVRRSAWSTARATAPKPWPANSPSRARRSPSTRGRRAPRRCAAPASSSTPPASAWTGEPPLDLALDALPPRGGGHRHRLCAAGNRAARGRAGAGQPYRRRARHAAASGPAGFRGVVRRRGAGHAGACARRCWRHFRQRGDRPRPHRLDRHGQEHRRGDAAPARGAGLRRRCRDPQNAWARRQRGRGGRGRVSRRARRNRRGSTAACSARASSANPRHCGGSKRSCIRWCARTSAGWSRGSGRAARSWRCSTSRCCSRPAGSTACDGVIVVSAPLRLQRERVLRRPGMSLERFNAILRSQYAGSAKAPARRFRGQHGAEPGRSGAAADEHCPAG